MVNYYYYYGLPLTLIFKIFKYDYHPHMNYHPIRSLFGAHRDTKVLTHHIHDIPTIIQLSWKGTWVLSDYTYIYIQIYIQIHIIIFPLYQLTWSCYNGYRCSPAYPHHIPIISPSYPTLSSIISTLLLYFPCNPIYPIIIRSTMVSIYPLSSLELQPVIPAA